MSISTEAVIECIGSIKDQWTTRDVAERLGVPERAVRTAVQWLSNNDRIRKVTTKERKTADGRSVYQVTVYEIAPVNDCDCALLNKIFMGIDNARK